MMCSAQAAEIDPLEQLIETQQKVETVPAEKDDLPPFTFLGDATMAELYSPAASGDKGNVLCQEVPFDELLSSSEKSANGSEHTISISMDSVRQKMNDICLIQKGDYVMAIGLVELRYVSVKDFVIRSERSVCPTDPPYSLWISFGEPLPDQPLFYSTNQDLKEGPTEFVAADQLPVVPFAPDRQKEISRLVKNLGDYKSTVMEVNKPNIDRLIMLHRQYISTDDDSLPIDICLFEKNGKPEILWLEKVDVKKGSGHLRLKGILDFNRDGQADLLLEGDRGGCFYTQIFEGTEAGFRSVEVPVKPCSC